jgi:colicin import membrane protein
MTEKKDEQNSEKETRKAVSEDVERFFRDVWGKVVEYASLGAEEATKLSTTAKTRVDIETLKFKRGKIIKMLGERYLDLCEKDPSLVLKGTTEILSDIRNLDKEIISLEKEMAKEKKAEKKKPAKSAAKKAAPKKTPAKKKAPAKKAAPAKATGKKPAEPKTTDTPPETPETGQ